MTAFFFISDSYGIHYHKNTLFLFFFWIRLNFSQSQNSNLITNKGELDLCYPAARTCLKVSNGGKSDEILSIEKVIFTINYRQHQGNDHVFHFLKFVVVVAACFTWVLNRRFFYAKFQFHFQTKLQTVFILNVYATHWFERLKVWKRKIIFSWLLELRWRDFGERAREREKRAPPA